MDTSKVPMTVQGKESLELELKDLMQNVRPAVIKAIEVARDHGDLSENADYDAAKEKQAFVEARITDLKGKISNAEVIDTKGMTSDRITFGANVVLLDMETDKEVEYQIVGEDEADVKAGKISVYSPIARSIIGKAQGDEIEFKSPKGEKEFEIVKFYFK